MAATTHDSADGLVNNAPIFAAFRGRHIALGVYEAEYLVRQVELTIDNFYVHLPLKMSSMGVDPLQELRVLRDSVKYSREDLTIYQRIRDILRRLRDRHTNFILPPPWHNATAFLPISMESCWIHNERVMVVTKSLGEFSEGGIVAGDVVTHWNGVPIGRFIEHFANQTLGANPFARIALAVRSITSRALAHDAWPLEDWVTLTFEKNGKAKSVAAPWRVYAPDLVGNVGNQFEMYSGNSTTVGWDSHLSEVNKTWNSMFSASGDVTDDEYIIPKYARKDSLDVDGSNVGYLRIFSFESEDPKKFVESVGNIVNSFDADVIIIDVRGNPGGNILCGEGLLQQISSERIEPAPCSFRNTEAIRRLCSSMPMFSMWNPSTEAAVDTGEVFSQGFPVSEDEYMREIPSLYGKKVGLIVDGLSYSTTDFLAAGFKDHNRGVIVGTDPMMGAGGANVWTHSLVVNFCRTAGMYEYGSLPYGASLNVAVRRSTGVNGSLGMPVENFGAKPHYWYKLTDKDLLHNNCSLIRYAAQRALQS